MNFKAGLLQSLDYLEPFRPDRINQDINLVRLNQKRGVPDPGNAYFAFADFRKVRLRMIASALGEKRRNQDTGQKIALVPVSSRAQPDACRIPQALGRRAIARSLANNVSPALFRKTNWHGAPTI